MWKWIMVLVVGCAHEPIGDDRVRPAPGPKPIEEKPMPPVELSELVAKLAEVKTFALGGVGYAGAPNEGEQLAREIAKHPDAVATFDKLAVHGNRVARLYAYWALRTLDPPRAAAHAPLLLADPTTVESMAGCSMFQAETKQLAAQLQTHPRTLKQR